MFLTIYYADKEFASLKRYMQIINHLVDQLG